MIGENEREVLLSMEPGAGEAPSWLRPLDVGGRDGSHHSATLAKLERRGWVESEQRSAWPGRRGSKLYRLTLAGLGELRALKQSWGQRR